jgi:hypothetical protein
VRTLEAVEGIRCPADYKSAIQQIENLRYVVTGPSPADGRPHSMLDIPHSMEFFMARFLATRGINEC